MRVNTIMPVIVDSVMTNPNPETRPWLEANTVQSTPMKSFGPPEEVADVCMFLDRESKQLCHRAAVGCRWGVWLWDIRKLRVDLTHPAMKIAMM